MYMLHKSTVDKVRNQGQIGEYLSFTYFLLITKWTFLIFELFFFNLIFIFILELEVPL